MRYDFSRRRDWLPLFDGQINAPVNFIMNKVKYQSKRNVEQLEMQLEKQIKKQMAKLRQLDRTVWNPHLSSSFKNVLRSFEMNCMYNKNHFETMTELNTVIAHYEVNVLIVKNVVIHSVKLCQTIHFHLTRFIKFNLFYPLFNVIILEYFSIMKIMFIWSTSLKYSILLNIFNEYIKLSI